MIEKVVMDGKVMFATPSQTLNYEHQKILALSDEEFAKLYLEKMTEYKDKDGWWSGDKIPHCGVCHEVISGPENLRRYNGRTLDSGCFKKVFEEEGTETGIMREYWTRVANLDLEPLVPSKNAD